MLSVDFLPDLIKFKKKLFREGGEIYKNVSANFFNWKKYFFALGVNWNLGKFGFLFDKI